MSVNPYEPPKARVEDARAGEKKSPVPLWNPNAAANWSLLFTPIFGAWLHMLNWSTLGETGKAATAKGWLWASVLMLPVHLVLMFVVKQDLGSLPQLAYLFLWYFAAARPQAAYVKEQFGKDYPRRGWGQPILIGVVALLAFYVVAFIGIAGMLASFRR